MLLRGEAFGISAFGTIRGHWRDFGALIVFRCSDDLKSLGMRIEVLVCELWSVTFKFLVLQVFFGILRRGVGWILRWIENVEK